jgi:hypothetical protein
VGDDRTPPGATNQEWLAEIFGPDPSAAPSAHPSQPPGDDTTVSGASVVNLDASADNEIPNGADESAASDNANAGAKKTAIVLAAGLVVAATAIVAALVIFSASPPAPPTHRPAPAAAISVPAPATVAAPAEQDQSVRFTASANCPTGSTSAQAVTDTSSDSAWVCARGGVDGQVLHCDLGETYVLTAVSVTPGWVAKTAGGKDEWLQHRVVTRLQYIFNDTERTIVTQDTANAHGPVVLRLKKILASRVTVIVLQTSRPPTGPKLTTDPTTAAQSGGFLDSVLGDGGAPLAPDATQSTDPAPASGEQSSDPVDATFAITALKFLGHLPM